MSIEIKGSGTSFQVFHNGATVGRTQNSYEKACIVANTYEKKLRRKVIPCLCCRKSFTSDGPGNRMCNDCCAFAAQAMA